jgi:hypothetical protein
MTESGTFRRFHSDAFFTNERKASVTGQWGTRNTRNRFAYTARSSTFQRVALLLRLLGRGGFGRARASRPMSRGPEAVDAPRVYRR